MNCDGIKELLSEGRGLPESAQHHLASCPGCRAMLEALTPSEAHLESDRIGRLQKLITASLQPVRPLPSDRTLGWTILGFFTVFSLIAALPVGYAGFHVLTPSQRVVYYALILLCAGWFSIATVQEMIPGSKRMTSPQWTIAASTLALALLVSILFRNFDLHGFVPRGIPCLRLGSICAVISGALSWLILRKGFFTSPVTAAATVGFFAGLAGVAVLALHCPIQNSAHIIVWHLGAMVLGGLGGAAIGTLRR